MIHRQSLLLICHYHTHKRESAENESLDISLHLTHTHIAICTYTSNVCVCVCRPAECVVISLHYASGLRGGTERYDWTISPMEGEQIGCDSLESRRSDEVSCMRTCVYVLAYVGFCVSKVFNVDLRPSVLESFLIDMLRHQHY